jgi:acetyl-CoA/propionyl-CoA carboxylase, biotin carboxylase, biotin carboxyl carrier protein
VPARAEATGGSLLASYGGRTRQYTYAHDNGSAGAVLWLARDGHTWALTEQAPVAGRDDRAMAGDGIVRSPMPGTVLAVHIAEGDQVTSGQPLLIVEAMKMEHTVTSPLDGVVAKLLARAGQPAGMDETLAVIDPGS